MIFVGYEMRQILRFCVILYNVSTAVKQQLSVYLTKRLIDEMGKILHSILNWMGVLF